jgi:peptidoglycan/LPS O-acetylase OafA/YrhL
MAAALHSYRTDIEGLRGIAILMVVLYHAGVPGFSGGYVGVDVFFVLSGYLITGLIAEEIRETGSLKLTAFYARRARRLLPALSFMLAGTALLSYFAYTPFEQRIPANSVITSAAYVGNLYFARNATDYLLADRSANPLLHTWSLSVEEQFYLLWPLLVLLTRRRLALSLCVVASLSLCVWLTNHHQPWAFFTMPARAWEFGIGGLAALSGRKTKLGWLGLAAVLLSCAAFSERIPFPGIYAALPALGAVLALAASNPSLKSFLSLKLLQHAGRLSYSWYLWHWPILAIASAQTLGGRLAWLLFSLVPAVLSYRYVESPLRKLPATRKTLAFGLCLSLVCACGGLAWRQGLKGMSGRPPSAAEDSPSIENDSCSAQFDGDALAECSFGDGPAIVLFGDSHAEQWFPALEGGPWRLTTFIRLACTPADADYYYPPVGPSTKCSAWRREVLGRVGQLRPRLIFVAGSSLYAGGMISDAAYAEGLRRTLETLRASGAKVYLLKDLPLPGFDVPACLAQTRFRKFLTHDRPCTFPRAFRENVVSDEARAAAEAGAEYIDLTPYVCPGETCRPVVNGTVTFRDGEHLTASFAATLAPVFRELTADNHLKN